MRNSAKYLPALVLLVFFFRSWGQGSNEIILELRPAFAGKELNLGKYACAMAGGDTVRIDRFRFYLSALVLVYEDGSEYREENSYHLVDAEEPGTLQIRLAKARAARISGLKFNIGVDSAASVAGALAGDLDPVKGMYWAWNSGYINAKLEGSCKTKPGQKSRTFEFHVGGYLQPHYALRQVKLDLPKATSDEKITIQCDAAKWLEGVEFEKENSVVIPGAEAMRVADRYEKMFSLLQ